MAIWMDTYGYNDIDQVPYVPVPQNLLDHFPQTNEKGIYVICKDSLRTHAHALWL